MTRKILVYVNTLANKHPALQRALHMAQRDPVQLKIIDVANGPSDALRELHRPMRSLIEQERKDQLDAICQPLHKLNIEFRTELFRGRPFTEIIREVVHEGFHLVIKTASGRQPSDIMGIMGIMGPVDMRLVRNCPCPVWLEAPGREVHCKRILVAVDPQAEDDELNISLLEMAESLVKSSEDEIHVISAWEVPDEEFLADIMESEKLENYVYGVKLAAKKSLDALLARYEGAIEPKNVHFKKGKPARTILDYVKSYKPDVTVIGTVGHINVRGLLIGNTADRVLREINCSVLAIKPKGLFRS